MASEPIGRAEAERRDGVLRAYLAGCDWDLTGEASLRRHLVLHSATLLPDFPLLVGLEWSARTGHAGDLLFFDGDRKLLAVEIKVTDKRAKARRLHKVEAQARDFARGAQVVFPWARVEGRIYTSVEHAAGRCPRAPRENRLTAKGYTPQAEGGDVEEGEL
ncbi:MAG: hypothetical protein EXR69_05155 [Myxococcales bacterium]|nr:hypothetical protein [Myxococcales bacterium]